LIARKLTTKSIPERIKIRREEGYHTHHIGRIQDGTQFMAFVVGIDPAQAIPAGKGRPRWYAVLHRFDSDGKHLGTEANFLGAKSFATELDHADDTLMRMIHNLGRVVYRDITIEPFSKKIDGYTFGLKDASVPREGYQRLDLLPNNLAFFPPWDGTYET
jgi:hypothetical protein